ncbi:hypothetical protein ASC95_28235 [Pelomonas sp. Root1217]|nr:hypothetical protein ASC95_28235 [Pelomonas sp. Root1217]
MSSPTVAQSHFTAVRAQIDLDEVPVVKVIETWKDPFFAEVGGLPGIYAKARASYGNNGAFAAADHQPVNLGAYAESIWSDSFNITGAVGAGSLAISVAVNGTVDGNGQPGGPGSNAFYQLFVSDSPISCDFDLALCTGTRLIVADGISGSHQFDAELPFTYGTTFYVASYLGAEVLGNGVADFYHSAHFGATAAGNVSVTGSSGFTYALAASVPEPTDGALLLAGLTSLALLRRRATRAQSR